ncbi:phosphoethanolamine transferase [Helicobacter sp. MIT 21-1697]|uniref:phosphoethanolamine transferase n=1 Tax=Helicobacter sp. MIT 21-1697 TaxID=2993733 RepID=UPI00224B003D|nr:phosphoethanolamine transferase [Helicobacter sp. MIT 21-1697]MCX2716838.1 phosphoethanolamine transferase [Helicobacter sp. MIT 21-1697]
MSIFHRIIEYFLVLCFFIIGLIEIFLALVFETQFNPIFFGITLSTNLLETQEFLSFYALSPKVLFSFFVFSLLSFVFLFPKYNIIHLLHFTLKSHHSRLIGLILFLVIFIVLTPRIYSASLQGWLSQKNALFRYGNVITLTLIETNSYITQYKNLSQTLKENLAQREQNEILSNTLELPTIVLIIGESTQRNYMSLYNYALPTTPKLNALVKSGNLIVFDDVISPHSHTNQALQKVLTFSNYENTQIPWFMQQNILDILNLAGYKTHWLSNQEMVSIYGNVPEVISQRAQYTAFSSKNDSYRAGNLYDGILLSMLQDVPPSENTKNFYAFHLMGTHMTYRHRYPKAFAQFSPQTLKAHNLDTFVHSHQKLDDSQLETKSHYLNAILYNDYVVSSIIESFADKEALIIYLSDHGDEVYDFRDFAGHNESMGSRFMIEVPFMVYMSEGFKEKYPDIFTKVQQAKDKPFMSDDFIHSFLDLLGIVSKDSVSSRSIFSPSYNQNRARIFSGKDYDRDLKIHNTFKYNEVSIVPSRLWLHRVDEKAKFEDFKEKYRGFEIDVHFLANPTPYFDVGHDGEDSSINLNLAEMFALIQKQNIQHLSGGGG